MNADGRVRWLLVVLVTVACGRTLSESGDDSTLGTDGGAPHRDPTPAQGGKGQVPNGGSSSSPIPAGAGWTQRPDGMAGATANEGGTPPSTGGVAGTPAEGGGSGEESGGSQGGAGFEPQGGGHDGPQGGVAGASEPEPWSAAGAAVDEDCAIAEPDLVPITDRRDVVIDEVRCKLYVSTDEGTVYAYDLKSHEIEPLISFGSQLYGMDLSPRRGTLIVTDGNASPYADDKRNYVHLVNIETRESRRYYFPLESLESGTFMPLFVSNEYFLLTSNFAGSGWVPLRRVSVRDGSFETLRYVSQSTMLALSADGSAVAFAEPNNSGGPFGRMALLDGTVAEGSANWFVYEIAINRDATQLAVPVYGGLLVTNYAGDFGPPTNLGTYVDHYALGVAYSPDSDILYASMTDVFGENTSIEVFDSVTLTPLFTLDDAPGLESVGNWALNSGRLRIARNGEILAATVNGGVRVYPARQP